MILGIADICLLDHLRAGMTRNDFVRRAAALGVQAASVRLLAGDEGADPVIAAEVGVECGIPHWDRRSRRTVGLYTPSACPGR